MKIDMDNNFIDSNISWLGKIPKKWEVKKIGWFFHAEKGKKASLLTKEYCGQNIGDYPVYSGQTQDNGVMACIDDYEFNFSNIKVLFSTTVGAKAMHLSTLSGKFSLSQNCMIFYSYSPLINVDFIYYHLQPLFTYERGLIPDHMQASFRMEDLYNYRFCLPTIEEQELIVQFLNKEVKKIDSLINEKQSFINLLKEKRQSLITHFVTKGLDPNVPMKNSGVEWIGDVPQHWDCLKYKQVFKIKKRIAGKLGFDVLSITQKGIKVKDIESGGGQLSSDYSKYQIVKKGDFAMNHMDLLTGFVDLSQYEGVTSPDYRVFELSKPEFEPRFFLYLLQMGYLEKLFYPYGQGAAHIGRWRLPTDAFKEFFAPCPPPEEQRIIADAIENAVSRYLQLIDDVTESIELLKERRSALITAAVTGKIDVSQMNTQEYKEVI